jgi:hypothetical protein
LEDVSASLFVVVNMFFGGIFVGVHNFFCTCSDGIMADGVDKVQRNDFNDCGAVYVTAFSFSYDTCTHSVIVTQINSSENGT